MLKIYLFLLTLFIFKTGVGQTNVSVYVISPFHIKDFPEARKCLDIKLTSVTEKLVFYTGGRKMDSLYRDVFSISQKKDSLALRMVIPLDIIGKSDSMSIYPTYHFACKHKGIRGSFAINDEGKATSKNVILLKLISDPRGATVYLIPKYLWDTEPRLKRHDVEMLRAFRVQQGLTPIRTPVLEYVYISLFRYKNKYIAVECKPVHTRLVDSAYVQFRKNEDN